ncbi:hypothetical protein NMY22_g8359 [Coprinellus aureogranulatus]|nr:hypothetical protein NMY22_g8359 [Coprinellus aureogranulatus]
MGNMEIAQVCVCENPLANIPGPPPANWITGNLAQLVAKDNWEFHEECVKKYGRVFSWAAPLGQRSLYVHDPRALQHIFLKEQHIYEEHHDFVQTNHRVFGKGLLATMGEVHKRQRKMLNPVFSSTHLRDMTPAFHAVAHKLRNGIEKQLSQGEESIDMLQWMSRTALELIGQSGFGHSFDNLEPNAKEHPVGLAVRDILYVGLLLTPCYLRFTQQYSSGALNTGMIAVVRMMVHETKFDWGSPAFQRAVVDLLPWKALRNICDIVDTLHGTSVDIFERTKRELAEGKSTSKAVGGGKNIMSILVKANMSASKEDRLPDDEILGQISTFIFAGTDTTSNALARTLDVLSRHPDAQERLRREVISADSEHGRDLDFDTLMGLPYLDAVCRETLRLYAPIPLVVRSVTRDVAMPLSEPIVGVDGREVSEILLPKNTCIIASLIHCNRDPLIWGPDANEWKPERWLGPLPESVTNTRVPGIFSHLMSFIGGSRSCIGFKFSQLEMSALSPSYLKGMISYVEGPRVEVVLSTLVRSFKFEPTGQKIMWQSNGIFQPTTEDAPRNKIGEMKLQLPLRVSLVK